MVCSYCSKIFNHLNPSAADGNISNRHHNLPLSHGTCPDCLLKNFPHEYLKIQRDGRQRIKKTFKNKYVDVTHVFTED